MTALANEVKQRVRDFLNAVNSTLVRADRLSGEGLETPC